MGCSVGSVGTQAFKSWLDRREGGQVRVEGLDLAPQMLAVAWAGDLQEGIAAWHHAAAEAGFRNGRREAAVARHRMLVVATR